MREKSFLEVLEDQMREQIRSELMKELEEKFRMTRPTPIDTEAAKAGRFETWLASHVGKTVFSTEASAKRAYASQPRAKMKQEPAPTLGEEPRARALTMEELIALELLRRHSGVTIPEPFTELQLKGAWRKAALKTHPDRLADADAITQAKAAALFRELAAAYDLLQLYVKTVAA